MEFVAVSFWIDWGVQYDYAHEIKGFDGVERLREEEGAEEEEQS